MPNAELSIAGDCAIITGSGSGIGKEIATQFVSHGVNVVLNDIDQAVLDETATILADMPGSIETVPGDISQPVTATSLVQTAMDVGGVDILVNNVGVAGPTEPCEDIGIDEFMGTLATNLGGLHAMTSTAIPQLSSGGRIVNIASISGKQPLKFRTPYVTSKMGVIGYTRTLAVELAPRDITVNAICPGSVEGDRLNQVIEGQARQKGRPLEEIRAEFKESSPLESFVKPSDIAAVALFLCSHSADRITGQDLNVSAGAVMY